MDEMMRRFRIGASKPARFERGAPDRDSLARWFLAALSREDTTTLGNLLVTRGEFAWLVFPDHLYAKAPYELDPEIFWLQLQAQTSEGLSQLLRRRGGRSMRFLSLQCQADTLAGKGPEVRFWAPCAVRYIVSDTVRNEQLFGSIVEYRGTAKFLGYRPSF
jgi:hypothetical protein